MNWPTAIDELTDVQHRLAAGRPGPWLPSGPVIDVAGVFVCFGRGGSGPGALGDPGWSAAVTVRDGAVTASAVVAGEAGGPYEPGYLARREGPLLEAAVRSLPVVPEVIIVNATGRDHPRRAGLALHLGAVLDIPTVGVTHRPLIAVGAWPEASAGAFSLLRVHGESVASWMRTVEAVRPLVVHAGWRTSLDTARQVVMSVVEGRRTPEPLREARRLARTARHAAVASGDGT